MSERKLPTVRVGRVLYFALAGLIGLGLWGYINSGDDRVGWHGDDAEGVCHFLASHQADAATRQRGLSSQQRLQLKRAALQAAENVPWGVLNKMHRDLPDAFRDYYQQSLEETVTGLSENDAEARRSGRELHDRWLEWFTAERGEIRLPQDIVAGCRPAEAGEA